MDGDADAANQPAPSREADRAAGLPGSGFPGFDDRGGFGGGAADRPAADPFGSGQSSGQAAAGGQARGIDDAFSPDGRTLATTDNTTGAGALQPPGGDLDLASLDVRLPDRGREYLFSTRDEATITAVSVPTDLVTRALRLLLVGVGAIMLGLALRWLGRRRAS
jgi:hypothetical protein